MCSDGLHGLLTEDELLDVMSVSHLDEGCLRAIAMANARGGHDNITVVIARARPDSVPQESQVEVETSGRMSSGETDHHRDDVEHTQIISPIRRPRGEEDGDDPVARPSRARALDEAESPARRRTMMWLVIALVVLLLAIGAAAIVLLQLSKQSSTLGMNDSGSAPPGAAAWQ
jgi:hypothetical protein